MINFRVSLSLIIIFSFSLLIAKTNPDTVIIKDVDNNNLIEFIDEGSEGIIVIPQMDMLHRIKLINYIMLEVSFIIME